ncbi:MAG: PqqD family protein [Vicinamibacterales bacterium]
MTYSINSRAAQWRIVDGEAVVVHVDTSYYYSLNRTGTFIWTALSMAPQSASDLAKQLAQAFGIDQVRATADVAALLTALRDEDLVMEHRRGDTPA